MFRLLRRLTPAGVTMMTDIENTCRSCSRCLSPSHHVRGAGHHRRAGADARGRLDKLRRSGLCNCRRFIVGAIFTPPDVVSQLMLAVPLWLLYELGLLLARSSAFRKRTAAKERLPQVADS